MSLMKAIYEHLITKRKYNTLEIKLIGAREDAERLSIQLNTERRIHEKEKEIWKKALDEQEKEIIKLRKRNIKKKEIK